MIFFLFSSRRRHTRSDRDWSSDVCSSDLSLKREHAADPPVRIMSVEEVELAMRRGDPDRLRRLLAEWRMDDAYGSESFRNFYFHRHDADGSADAPYLLEAYDALFERAARELGIQLRKPLR